MKRFATVLVALFLTHINSAHALRVPLPKLYIVAVGISDYEDAKITDLDFAHRDAQEIAKAFQEHSQVFFSEIEVKVLTNQEASREKIFDALDWFQRSMTQKDFGVVFFAGHGQKDGKGSVYFLPVDAKHGKLAATAIDGDTLSKGLKNTPGQRLLIVDACHAGAISGTKTRHVPSDNQLKDLTSEEKGFAILCASLGQEESQENREHEHGVFTLALLEALNGTGNGLSGKSAIRVQKSDGAVYFKQLDFYVTARVRQLSKGYQHTITKTPESFRDFPLSKPRVARKRFTNSIGMEFVLIPRGTFNMGSPQTEKYREDDETQHEVAITKEFYMGVTEVTQAQYKRIMGTNPSPINSSGEGGDGAQGKDTGNLPVEQVTWEEAVAFCDRVNRLAAEREANRRYRLPTEAEWEYACRGRASSYQIFHFGNSLSSTQANFNGHTPYGKAPKGPHLRRATFVRSYQPNAFGLYDMHGNVWEWCSDWYAKDYYKNSPRKDPPGPASGTSHVLRGGSWLFFGYLCRSAKRFDVLPDSRSNGTGFRVVCVPQTNR